MEFTTMGDPIGSGGTGNRFGEAVLITTGVAAIIASLTTIMYDKQVKSKILLLTSASQIDMASVQELSQTLATTLCYTHFGHGTDLLHSILGQFDFD